MHKERILQMWWKMRSSKVRGGIFRCCHCKRRPSRVLFIIALVFPMRIDATSRLIYEAIWCNRGIKQVVKPESIIALRHFSRRIHQRILHSQMFHWHIQITVALFEIFEICLVLLVFVALTLWNQLVVQCFFIENFFSRFMENVRKRKVLLSGSHESKLRP